MQATNAVPRTSTLAQYRPGFMSTVRSEWTKLRSVRSTYILMGLAIVLSIGMTGLMSLIIGSTWSEWPPQQQAAFNPILFAFFGGLFSAILISVLGVIAVTNEYSSGMIRLTFTSTPKRGRVLLAKVLVVGLISLVAGTISVFGMFLVGQAVFASYGMETASLGDADALRAVVLVSLVSPAYPIVGATIAILLRSTAGAVTAILALIFVPTMFGGLLPRWWQENVLAYVLGPVTDSVAIQHISDPSPMFLNSGVAVVALAAWIIVPIAGAYIYLQRRDA